MIYFGAIIHNWIIHYWMFHNMFENDIGPDYEAIAKNHNRLLQYAQNPDTSSNELHTISKSRWLDVRVQVAKRPNVFSTTLHDLSKDKE